MRSSKEFFRPLSAELWLRKTSYWGMVWTKLATGGLEGHGDQFLEKAVRICLEAVLYRHQNCRS